MEANPDVDSQSVVGRRILAFGIDYLIILAYVGILTGITLALFAASGEDPSVVNPWRGQIVGIVTLTIPVYLYFSLLERSSLGGTVGKRAMGLRVIGSASSGRIFLRNLFKLLPWEIAHTGVHWLFYTMAETGSSPAWVYILLSIPQLMVLVYFISMLLSRGESSIYDKWAGTRILKNQ